ncbi:hypothetical protein SDC9_59966 [bioreactor metagenome]|uniref:F5/8 type C domain-containing protein n=1 Tax=bioreactor metagenome TaxID=1076179 RepID=A0A644XCU7_9ZZZZ
MKSVLSPVFFLLSVLFTLFADAEDSLIITRDGISNYCIIVCDKANANERTAAAILQQYLFRISGVSIPLYADDNPAAKNPAFVISAFPRGFCSEPAELLKEDGYCIQTSDNNIYITGGSGMGVIYGVTGFLEDYLGVRMLAPGEEFVPAMADVILPPINDIQIPPAEIRIVNGAFSGDTLYRYFRKLNTIEDRWNEPDWRGYYVHTFSRLVPPEKYFNEHPEYFALVNGNRVAHGQLCLSNPAVLQIVIDKLGSEMKAHPNIRYWSVSQNDNYEYCQCEKCRAMDSIEGSPAGLMLRFVNAVAEKFPDKTITTLAYQYTRKPPLITKPDSNVMITLCSIELNRTHPIAVEPGAASFREDMEGWGRISKNIMMWDYEVQFSNYLTPFPLFNTLQPNLQYFTANNVVANFQQCNAKHGVEFAELKSYLMSKLMWNPDVDVNAETDGFMRHYYGAAAPMIRKYYDLLHAECLRYNQFLDIYGNPVQAANTYLSAENISEYSSFFDTAESLVEEDPVLLSRVQIARLPVMFAEIEIAKTELFGLRGWYENIDGKWILKDRMIRLLEQFRRICVDNDVNEFNENGLTFGTWYENTQRFIHVQTEGNIAFQKNATCNPAADERYSAAGPATLTNGVKGTEDYKMNWLGWEAQDVEIVLDLGAVLPVDSIEISTLQYPKSWILHPLSVSCRLSKDGQKYDRPQIAFSAENLQSEPMMKTFVFSVSGKKTRYIKFNINATKTLPAWHNYAGMKSWVFVDEIVVK